MIEKLTGVIIPWWGRWAALAALAGGLLAFGYVRGFLHEEHKFDGYRAQVVEIGKQAAERNRQRAAEYESNRKQIGDQYEKDMAALRNQPPRVVFARPRGCPAVTPSPGPKAADAAPGESVAAGPDAEGEGAVDQVLVPQAFITACAVDALHVRAFQEYVVRNKLPVE